MCFANIMMGFCLKSVEKVKTFPWLALIRQCPSSKLFGRLSCNEQSADQSLRKRV